MERIELPNGCYLEKYANNRKRVTWHIHGADGRIFGELWGFQPPQAFAAAMAPKVSPTAEAVATEIMNTCIVKVVEDKNQFVTITFDHKTAASIIFRALEASAPSRLVEALERLSTNEAFVTMGVIDMKDRWCREVQARREFAEAALAAHKADQPDRFRTALESIAKNTCCDGCREAGKVAQKALDETGHAMPGDGEQQAKASVEARCEKASRRAEHNRKRRG